MKKFRVLVVDDERDFVDSLVRRLQRRGVDCEGVYSGAEARMKIDGSSFDVVLLDMLLPDTTGNGILRYIKGIRPETEVVMLTGHASVEAGRESLKYGAYDYLLKPLEMETLFERLLAAFTCKKEKYNKGSPQGVAVFGS